MSHQRIKFYQTGTFTVGNRLLDEVNRTIQSQEDRTNSLNSGHRACQGCGEVLGARYAIDAVMRATNNQLVAVNATGCLEVFSSPYPESAWQIPWMHSLFGNAPAVATGVAAALRAKGKNEIKVVAQGGDGATVDIGFGCLSGMFERNDEVLYICYDNEAYMNTGVQRSGATPPRAWTNTTQAVGVDPGNPMGVGKNVPKIAMAHGIPFVATASIADLHDLEDKVIKAMTIGGARYIHIHVPCPLGWKSDPALTVKVARMAVESGLFPLFQAEHGRVTDRTLIRHKVKVEKYLELQGRFKHLFNPPDTKAIAAIQAIADRNIQEYDLLDQEKCHGT
jgi:pyruvate ferredoxin oxidoreductase beta subunit